MRRIPQKGYLAPWSSRRETAGLMGALLVFLLGFPGHSETMLRQTQHLIQQLIRLTLVCLGFYAPATPPRMPLTVHRMSRMLDRISHMMPARAALPESPHASVAVDSNSMVLRSQQALHRMTYRFEGVATFQGQPCPQASVLIRLVSGEHSVTHGTVTGADGSYVLQTAIDAEDKDPVDWSIEAYTPDFKKVELSGRRIVQDEDAQDQNPIVVTMPVEFTLSSAK